MCKKSHPEKGEKACPHQKAVGKRGLCPRCQRKLAESNFRHYRAKEEARKAEEKAQKAKEAEAARAAQAGVEKDAGLRGPTIVVNSIEEMDAVLHGGEYSNCNIVLQLGG